MTLTDLKSSASLAKTSKAELELWQMEISPDDVLRLVEVAIAARLVLYRLNTRCPAHLLQDATDTLEKALEGIEP